MNARVAGSFGCCIFLKRKELFFHAFFKAALIFQCVFTTSIFAVAQSDIPIGTWRVHASYNAINSIALAENKVFGAASNGVMILDRSENVLSVYSKLSGLSGTTITSVNYDKSTASLIIAYADGGFDVIRSDSEIMTFDPTKNSTFTSSKKIHDIFLYKTNAYLSTDYGIVVFDMVRQQVKETWRDLGEQGETLSIKQSTVNGDSIFLATKKGVMASNLNANLLDFNSWKRFDMEEFNGPVESIASFNGSIYAAINNSGIHSYKGGGWIKENYLQQNSFRSLHASSSSLFIAAGNTLWKLSKDNVLSEITSPLLGEPRFAVEDLDGFLWIGDGKNGLVSNVSGSFKNFLPNCPSNGKARHLNYEAGVLYALAGGYSVEGLRLENPGNTDLHLNGIWTTEKSTILDLTDLVINHRTTKIYRSSFGFGVEERDAWGGIKLFDETNSPLINTDRMGRSVNIPSVETSAEGLWIANYGAAEPLHLLKDDQTWESFSFPLPASRYPLQLAIDFFGSVWMVLNPVQGGGILVFNKSKNAAAYLTNVAGSGGLPGQSVYSIDVDRDGMVWIGTDQGVAYVINPSEVFSPGVDAIKPIFENRFLLRDDKVTAIAVDGGNRKWMGTERGVWLFNSTGEELIYNFTTDNSPLLSNTIRDIEINDQTGEVFFATDEGLISFRADATESNFTFQSVKVFPNPVTANFAGSVGISGLATDALVKITDVTGKLIWQTQANGGTATWNVQDNKGRRATTGIYLIFSATANGEESIVAKIAVVD
jgi:Two component regulator propeller